LNRATQLQEGMEKHKKRGSLMSIPFSIPKEKKEAQNYYHKIGRQQNRPPSYP
jgi:hypothetical protein